MFAVLLLLICCFSQAFGQTVKKIDDASAWLYHPDKDQYVGSYEWWYMDAHLDNGWLVAVVFGVPRATSLEYYKYRADLAAGLPVPSYDPKNYAALGFNVTDEKGRHLFEATEKVPIDRPPAADPGEDAACLQRLSVGDEQDRCLADLYGQDGHPGTRTAMLRKRPWFSMPWSPRYRPAGGAPSMPR